MISLTISSSNDIFNGEVSVDQSMTLSNLKRQLEQYTHISHDSQRILFKGNSLSGDGPLRNYGLQDKDTLYVVDRSRGIPAPRIQVPRTIPYTPFGRNRPNDRISTLTLSAMGARHPTTNCRDVTLPPFHTRFEHIRQNLMTYETLMGDFNIRPSKYFYRNYNYSPLTRRNQRQFFVGQLIDCLDTVKSWLEATITKIEYETVINPDTGESKNQMKLLVHFNGWPTRWDEYIESDSHRISLFRTHTLHSFYSSHASPTQFCWVPDMFPTGDDDISLIFLALHECFGPLFSYLYSFSFESENIFKNNRQHQTQANQSNQYITLLSKKLVPMCDRLGRILIDTSVSLDSINLNIFTNRPPRLHRPLFLVQLDTPTNEVSQLFNPAVLMSNNQPAFFNRISPVSQIVAPTTQTQQNNSTNTSQYSANMINNDPINPIINDNIYNYNISDIYSSLTDLFFNNEDLSGNMNDVLPWNKYLPLQFSTRNINRIIINLLYPSINIYTFSQYYKKYKINQSNKPKFNLSQLYSDYMNDIFDPHNTYNLTNNKLYRNINSPLNFGASLLANQGCIELQHPFTYPHYEQLLQSPILVQNTSSLIPPPYQSVSSGFRNSLQSRISTSANTNRSNSTNTSTNTLRHSSSVNISRPSLSTQLSIPTTDRDDISSGSDSDDAQDNDQELQGTVNNVSHEENEDDSSSDIDGDVD